MTDPSDLASLQQADADAIEERRRLHEVRPPNLPVDGKVADLRARLDSMTHPD